ncbi:type II secretion system GspH family protein [Anaerovorax odorimutans]|uniref:Type II secretion system GspH family protein n=1 Tax=Anaerovorax odorimutans TaxID=109327 RepID=A0ABT1RS48_9FIRM|nr:type II secretion system protein [Anaerovorax odorimutans]MCQ4638016.1 type II secretion system GspH family protein [Anaerovorax odorimutans]
MFSDAGRRKKGFTLVEILVTLTILAILAAIAVPTGIRYMENAKQTARDKVARSVFLAAQKALTSKVSSGDKMYLASDQKVDAAKIPGFTDTQNKDNIVYLSINQTTKDKNSQALYMLLDPYLTDKEILENTVLIEYNKKTGKVYAAFYSEVVPAIGYGGGSGDTYDAYKRSEQERKDGKMGYWGVDSTGIAGEKEETVKSNIQLVDYDMAKGETGESKGHNINRGENYGLLTVECTLPSEAELAGVKSLTLTLKGAGLESVTIENDKTGQIQNVITLDQIGQKADVTAALTQPFKIQEGNQIKNYPMYIENTADGHRILVWVLDSQAKGMGIYENHSSLGTGTITAQMQINGDESKTYEAEPVHALFSKEYSEDGKTAYGIKSVRHLNNIRYTSKTIADADKRYVQMKDVACRDYKDEALEWVPIGDQGKALPAVKTEYEWGRTHGFFGLYEGRQHTIYDLTISKDGKDKNGKVYAMTGLFSCISAQGSVADLELDYTEAYWNDKDSDHDYFISGYNRVGGIAGENWGTVSRCTVQGRFYAAGGEAKVGAIIGKNMGGRGSENGPGLVTQCVAAADVMAEEPQVGQEAEGALAGGIVGDNYGRITYCESGTASDEGKDDRGEFVTEPYFGVKTDLSRSDLNDYDEAENDVYKISGSRGAGGIAGQIRASEFGVSPEIRYCVNAAEVESDNGAAGGLAGRYYSQFGSDHKINNVSHPIPVKVTLSYNAGEVSAKDFAGGVVGTYKNNDLVNQNPYYNEIRSCYNTGEVEAKGENGLAGGIIAKYGMFTEIHDCYNIGKVKSKKGTANGVFCAKVGDRPNSCVNCAAITSSSSNSSKDSLGRMFLPKKELQKNPFDGMSPGGDVGPFDYEYPYLTVTEINGTPCGLGSSFHRTGD